MHISSFIAFFRIATPHLKNRKIGQLRALEMGMQLPFVNPVPYVGVDHPDDLDRFAKLLSRKI